MQKWKSKQKWILFDMEGILTPEIWVNVAEKYKIEELRTTTRDEPDYDKLMRGRIEILREYNISLYNIQEVIQNMGPLEDAREFLDIMREIYNVALVSDTFTQFAKPLIEQLGQPTLFCNELEIDTKGMIVSHVMRQENGKQHVAELYRKLNYGVIAVGDSYNDINMLKAAYRGILYKPPTQVVEKFPQFPVTRDYSQLETAIHKAVESLDKK